MKDRILKILDKEKLTATKFADRIGVQRSSISHIISGRNKPSFDFISKTIDSFPYINAEWLISGKGNMYKEEEISDRDKMKEPELFKNDEKKAGSESGKTYVNNGRSEDTKDIKVTEELITREAVTNVTKIEKVIILFSNNTFKEYYKMD